MSSTELLDIAHGGAGSRPRRCRELDSAGEPAWLPVAREGAAPARRGRRPPGRPLRHLQKLLAASIDDLQTVDGVGDSRARSVREGLSRLAESSILERYV